MAKIAISLPDEVLESIEREREGTGETRSEFMRRAVDALLKQKEKQIITDQYVRGYQQNPETEEEVLIAEYASTQALAENPWEDGPDQ